MGVPLHYRPRERIGLGQTLHGRICGCAGPCTTGRWSFRVRLLRVHRTGRDSAESGLRLAGPHGSLESAPYRARTPSPRAYYSNEREPKWSLSAKNWPCWPKSIVWNCSKWLLMRWFSQWQLPRACVGAPVVPAPPEGRPELDPAESPPRGLRFRTARRRPNLPRQVAPRSAIVMQRRPCPCPPSRHFMLIFIYCRWFSFCPALFPPFHVRYTSAHCPDSLPNKNCILRRRMTAGPPRTPIRHIEFKWKSFA